MISSKLKRRLWMLVLMWVALPGIFLLMKHWRGAMALQGWKTEMQARGERFSLDGSGLEPESARIPPAIVRAAQGLSALPGPAYSPGIIMTGPDRARAAWRGEAVEAGSGESVAWETVVDQLKLAEALLADLQAALLEPDDGVNRDGRTPATPAFESLLQEELVARWLARAIETHLHLGDHAALLENSRTLLGLVRWRENGPALVAQMTRAAIANVALESVWAALDSPDWTDAELAYLQSQWLRADFMGPYGRALEFERARVVTHLDRMKASSDHLLPSVSGGAPGNPWESGFDHYVMAPLWRLAWADEDQLHFLKMTQPLIESFRSGETHRSLPSMRRHMRAGQSEVRRSEESVLDSLRPWRPGELIDGERVLSVCARVETFKELAVTAMALRRYELAQGGSPTDLSELVPGFAASVGWDWMAGAPLVYRAQGDGSWLLYSVGNNGRDDGGDGRPAEGDLEGIWSGNDALWPIYTP